jgi:hypothetical protein
MADLRVHVSEAIIRDDLRRLKMLELRRISACIFGKFDEQLGTLKVAIVVRSDIGNEVGGVVQADGVVVDFEFHLFLQ